ncbi:MAG: hypothetical protein K9M98_13625, partial [Cephaloticoccus sp.]|nr:hypothetical protein [Cephaloticoccus sp.]
MNATLEIILVDCSFISPTRRQTLTGVLWVLLMIGAVLIVWLRNRDILRDLYDYATLIGAAGKTEAGFRPYTDVRSPMQTSVYIFNWLSERSFGATYLGLSMGGLVQALGGGLMFCLLLWRRIGPPATAWFTGAFMLAGCIQHMGFFYNPIGILCFGVVVVGLARGGCLWPWRGSDAWLVVVALAIGGINKLNFHGLALAFGGGLILRSWLAGEITGRAFWGHAAVMTGAGVGLPFAFELVWTGATPAIWWQEVVAQPTARFDAARHFLDLRIFLQPANDYHHHILFRPMGGVGLLLLLVTGGWALQLRRRLGAEWLELLCGVALLLGGMAGSALLMVTNYETVVLTSLAFLFSALAIYLAVRQQVESAGQLRIRQLLLAGAVLWTIDGGYAAWHGSRLLYAQNPPPRSDYER